MVRRIAEARWSTLHPRAQGINFLCVSRNNKHLLTNIVSGLINNMIDHFYLSQLTQYKYILNIVYLNLYSFRFSQLSFLSTKSTPFCAVEIHPITRRRRWWRHSSWACGTACPLTRSPAELLSWVSYDGVSYIEDILPGRVVCRMCNFRFVLCSFVFRIETRHDVAYNDCSGQIINNRLFTIRPTQSSYCQRDVACHNCC